MTVRLLLLTALLSLIPGWAQNPVVLVVTADASDYLLSAGGTIAGMAEHGATVYLIRVTNDEKDSYDLSPEETARRTNAESEEAARILGIKEVFCLGYRAAELADVSFTDIRDRLIFYLRLYKPRVLFIPNPYNEYDRVLDRYYTGSAAEGAWRAASFENYQLPFADVGLAPHQVPEVYYYGQPFDPRRREAESTPTFVPELRTVDISATLGRKIKAAEALKTINVSMARRLKDRLTATQRRLPLLEKVDERSIDALVQKNVEGLAAVCAGGTSYHAAEEFHYAGLHFRVLRNICARWSAVCVFALGNQRVRCRYPDSDGRRPACDPPGSNPPDQSRPWFRGGERGLREPAAASGYGQSLCAGRDHRQDPGGCCGPQPPCAQDPG